MRNLINKSLSVALVLIMVLGFATNGLQALAENTNEEMLQSQANQPFTLLEGNSLWKYADDGTDQGTVWQAVYDDSNWNTGQAPLGYKDNGTGVSTTVFGGLKTNISYGSNKSDKYRTTYFRTNVNVSLEQIKGFEKFEGTIAFDDGIVLYLNGTEIYREGMPAGAINYLTQSTYSNSDPNVSKVNLTDLVKANLKEGNNELAAEVHQANATSSDLYWDMSLIAYPAAEPVQPGKGKPESIALTFNGNPQTSMGFAWYAPETVTGTKLEVVEASKVTDGGFPADGLLTFEGTSSVASVYPSKADKSAGNTSAISSHKVIADNLRPGTKYAYRAGDGQDGNWSEIGTFTTEAADNSSYQFIYTTDSQGTTEPDFEIWNHTLQEGVSKFPDAEFILNSGDLVDNGDLEEQWGWFFGKPKDILENIPLVPLVGNHESKNYSNFTGHFNLPNVSNTGAKPDGSVYSFNYGPAHFMVLNTEYYGTSSNALNNEIYYKQVEWLRSEVAKSDKKWKIVLLHKSPYSVANHTNDKDVLFYRSELTKVFDELGIDMVIGGHDHTYARSYQMLNNVPLTDVVPDSAGTVTDPDGTLYLITNAAGNKKYNVASGPFPFAAKYGQPGKEMFTGFTVTEDELSYKAYTTITGGTTDLYDEYSIHKSDAAVPGVRNAQMVAGADGKITLTWEAPDTELPVSGYRVYEQNDLLGANWNTLVSTESGKTAYSYTVDNSDPAQNYQFVIKAVSGRNHSEAVIAGRPAVSKVTVTFHGDSLSSKGFTWYTPLISKNSDLQVTELTQDTPDFTKAITFSGRSAVSTNAKEEMVHKAEATGLKADTSYYFRVGDKLLGIWSAAGTFRTAPESGAFTFVDLADTQAKSEDEAILSSQTLAKALETVPDAHFVVHNGDIVDTGTKETQWDWLLGHSQNSLLHTTIAPSAGNHEDEANAFYEHFNIQEAPGSATETGAYYSYDYSNAHFVVLNSNEDSGMYANFSADQVEWLKADVQSAQKAGARWIIVNIHKGPYTTSNHATDKDIIGANGVRTKIAPLMAELGIDFVLQGHDHIYARTKPVKADGTAAATQKITETLNGTTVEYTVNPDGSIYLIPATAGAKVYYKNQKPELGKAYYDLFEAADENHAAPYGPDPSDSSRPKRGQIQNFVGITVNGDKLTAVSYEIDQNKNDAKPYIIEQFGIIKKKSDGGGTPTPEVPTPAPATPTPAPATPTPTPTATPVPGGSTGWTPASTPAPTHSASPAPTSTAAAVPSSSPAGNVDRPSTNPVLTDIGTHWAASAIQKALEAGFVNGYADNTFRPNREVNRAEFITMLARALKLPDNSSTGAFKDMDKIPVWARPYAAQAISAGIVSGYADGTFRPEQKLTRSELTVMIVRALGIKVDTQAKLTFTDAGDVPKWAAPYIAAAVDRSLVNGTGQNRFAPHRVATRAEAVALIVNLLENPIE
ncbi:S-layer homology domain-containing protein [Paenibacillus jilunlii]|uniref:Fibronectin type III domain-containing protein n=2 Tax=Paenibacillus jilunlii TaxID=682956 RepID=A0A1G9M7A7_9BACL|nr:S-layer homology domain-containing protein [Paenibacillus jilunlii]SDL69821.1 Fibronectin type III domain-containing protein [Paenibacillus jilunlii]